MERLSFQSIIKPKKDPKNKREEGQKGGERLPETGAPLSRPEQCLRRNPRRGKERSREILRL